MPEYPIMEIRWIDSKGVTSDWEFVSDIKPMKAAEIRSVGFLLEDTPDYITIAQSQGIESIDDGKQVLARMTIPKRAIIELKSLED